MRIIITAALAAAALAPVAAGAQSYGEGRQDQREVRQDQRDLRGAERQRNYGDARGPNQELREDRQETRGDWRDFRRTHPGAYRLGAYAGPRGYRYRPVAVGYRFDPVYYGRSYWLNDPSRYRLPAPAAYERWVRYGNDVVRVNLRTGRVVTVYNGFFY
ncbi:RcnB family protein [uncultured Sphingomonas sp.]|uniref:RcnB family protein n=1 Tax=uncultured Sphingomonas sp. TaxID=158754 RepID=UPI0035CA6692